LGPHGDGVWALAFHPTLPLFVSGGGDELLKFWDPQTGRLLRDFRAHESNVLAANFSPDGHTLASAGADGKIRLWTAQGQPLLSFPPPRPGYAGQGDLVEPSHDGAVYGLAYSPDGRLLASASHDNTLKLWDARTGQELRVLRGHTNAVQKVIFSPDGKSLLSASWDQTVRIWSIEGRLLQTLPGFSRPLYALAWSRQGTLAVGSGTAARGGTISLFRPR
jgi:WD40 repeat protein